MGEHDAVFDHIDCHFDEYLREIQRFLHQPGFSHTGEGIRESAEMAREYVRMIGTQDAQLVETDGNPVVFGHLLSKRPNAKTLALYSLYDEVPVVPEDWVVPPLEARILEATEIGAPAHLGQILCARASHNQRGPTLAAILALKSMQEVTGDLPVNILWAWEGEEEIGCPHLHQFIEAKLEDLRKADGVWQPSMRQDESGVMTVYRGSRATAKIELEIKGGEWGGSLSGQDLWSANLPLVDAPMGRMIRALHSLMDEEDRLTLDGLDTLIRPYGEDDRRDLAILEERFDEEGMRQALGIARYKGGKRGRDLVEQYTMRPMMNVVGIVGGYTGPKVFTTLPMRVVAKLDFRVPPNVTPGDVPRLLRAHLDRRGYREVEVRFLGGYGYSQTSSSDPLYEAAFRACRRHGCDYLVWPLRPGVGPFSMFNQPPLSKPFGDVGMGHGGRWHQANEYVTVEGLRDLMKFTVTYLNEWAAL